MIILERVGCLRIKRRASVIERNSVRTSRYIDFESVCLIMRAPVCQVSGIFRARSQNGGQNQKKITLNHSMKRAAANAAPPSTSAVTSGIAAFEVGVGLEVGVEVEVCEPVPAVAPEVVLLVEVTLLVESLVGVASALLDADETWAE